MASTPKRWLWILNVVAIVLGAWLVAGTVNAAISAKMSNAPSPSSGSRPPMPTSGPAKSLDAYLGPIKSRNVFNHGEPIPDEDVPVSGGATSAPPGACTSNIQLVSTVIATKNPELSLATIQDKDDNPPSIEVVQVGEKVGDATVTGVSEDYDDASLAFIGAIELTHPDGRKEICKSNADQTGAPAVSMAMPGSAAAPAAGSGVKRVDDTHYEVAQSTIDGVMNGGLADISTTVRIVPYFEGGQPKGFKMYSIQPGSLLANIGLMNGDVVEKINGYDLSTPEKALQVYGLLKNEKNITVDVSRNGQNKTMSYSIR